MSLELLNTLATFGTFVVITATATAGIIQLRHMRSANMIEGINYCKGSFESPEYHVARNFVISELSAKWQDPAFRHQLANPGARTPENQILITHIMLVANSHEQLGLLVKRGLIEPEMALDLFSGNALIAWEKLSAVAAAVRRSGDNRAWENFEYFAVLSEDWEKNHPDGTYPAGVRRIPLQDTFREDDERYAASL